MVLDFTATDWVVAFESEGVDHAQTKMDDVLTLIWDQICERLWLWKARNDMKHSKKSLATTDDLETIKSKLEWYIR